LRVLNGEPLPQFVAVRAEVAQDCEGVVEFVGQGDQDGVVRRVRQVADVSFPCAGAKAWLWKLWR
jgi:hypothetical protein